MNMLQFNRVFKLDSEAVGFSVVSSSSSVIYHERALWLQLSPFTPEQLAWLHGTFAAGTPGSSGEGPSLSDPPPPPPPPQHQSATQTLPYRRLTVSISSIVVLGSLSSALARISI